VALQTVEAIKDMIRLGQLRPEQALPPERELASALSISRPTLREAIGALTAMNILESRHGDGTFVTSLSPQLLSEPIAFLLQLDEGHLDQLLEVRKTLEADAAQLAAERISEQELGRLQELLEKLDGCLGDADAFAQLDFDLHAVIIAAVHNPLYSSLCESIAELSLEGRRRTARDPALREVSHQDHRAIVRAIARRAPAAARKAMLEHLAHVGAAMRAGRGSDDE
jgi:GntR family transcriptional repressor for pyruvate dehydrogenase complex